MLGFFAEAVDTTIAVGSELEHARWFSVDELDAELAAGSLLLSPRLSIARWLQESWYRRMTGRDVPSAARSG
jgi:NAD+ diphosphatase